MLWGGDRHQFMDHRARGDCNVTETTAKEESVMARFRLGVDVGGTFTDAVLISEETGEIYIAKVSSTPHDPSIGFLAAVTQILEKAKSQPQSISYLVHATTVATNALIEGKCPKSSFITTEGFRDMLEIARQVRPSLYDIHFQK